MHVELTDSLQARELLMGISCRRDDLDPEGILMLAIFRNRTRESLLASVSKWATQWTGTSAAFGLALLAVIIWAAVGPFFGYSDTWQLVINTGTTIVTFLMVFLIQRSQNKDSIAIHLKLNELVAAVNGASNRLINIEDLTEDEIKTLHTYYGKLAELAKKESNFGKCHSVEEAAARHKLKIGAAGQAGKDKSNGVVMT